MMTGQARRTLPVLVAMAGCALLLWWAVAPRPADIDAGLQLPPQTGGEPRVTRPDPSTRELTVGWQSDDCVDPDSARVSVAETAEYVQLEVDVARCPWWESLSLRQEPRVQLVPPIAMYALTAELEAPLGDRFAYVAAD